jgi:hypothetical protein
MPPFSPYGAAGEVMQYYEVPAEVPKAVVLDEGGFMKRILVAVFLATAVALPLPAQERHEWFVGVGVGPVRQDRQGNGLLLRDGGFYQIHGGLRWGRHLGARVDLVHASIGRNNGVAFLQGDPAFSLVPCPTAPFDCQTAFLGPVRVTGLSTGLEASWIDRRLLIRAGAAPGVYWLSDRPPGTRPVVPGVHVGFGGGYQLTSRLWAVMDLQYHRLFADGSSPDWLIPGSIGLELR